MNNVKRVNSLGPDPREVHVKLTSVYGAYDRFEELMNAYSRTIMPTDDGKINITRAIGVICNFRTDMFERNIRHYLPIINALDKRVMNLALECRGSTK